MLKLVVDNTRDRGVCVHHWNTTLIIKGTYPNVEKHLLRCKLCAKTMNVTYINGIIKPIDTLPDGA